MTTEHKPTYVTEPDLPALDEFIPYLKGIWERRWLTNGGPLVAELERNLADHLGVRNLSVVSNGTTALQLAIHALELQGEVITTPYSFVATSHVLLWQNLTPVFVDIDPVTLNLDPDRIESAITPRTSAILPVHCYGNPCRVEEIQAIADRHGLRVIYDAAHAFGVRKASQSILEYGDAATLSFHATKVFNTAEGGAIVCGSRELKKKIDLLRNFGIADELTVTDVGINGKMNEIQAALGLLQLKSIEVNKSVRASIDLRYRNEFAGIRGLRCLPTNGVDRNYSYFPIIVGDEFPLSRDELHDLLRREGIHARRYFFPLISDMPMYRGLPSARPSGLPVAQKSACQILCLPQFARLSDGELSRVIDVIRRAAD